MRRAGAWAHNQVGGIAMIARQALRLAATLYGWAMEHLRTA